MPCETKPMPFDPKSISDGTQISAVV